MGNNDTKVPGQFQSPSDVKVPKDLDLTNTTVSEARTSEMPNGGDQDRAQYFTMGLNNALRSVGKAILIKLSNMSRGNREQLDRIESTLARIEAK